MRSYASDHKTARKSWAFAAYFLHRLLRGGAPGTNSDENEFGNVCSSLQPRSGVA